MTGRFGRTRAGAAIAVLLVSAVMVTGCGRDQPPSALVGAETIAAAERAPLPPIAGRTLDGTHLSVADLRGRVVVLNAWASWCGPCRTETPVLVDLARTADPTQVAVVGLNVRDDADAATTFVEDFAMPYPSIVDADGSLLRTIPGVPPSALPSTVVLDRDGNLAARFVGELDASQLADVVTSLASASPAAA